MAKVALLIDRTFDDEPFRILFDRLREAGHEPVLIGPHEGHQVDGREGHMHLTLDASVDDANPEELDALIVPRGFRRDHLRTHERVLNFIRDVYGHGKPVGVLHENLWLLIPAEAQGRGFATWPAIKRDLVIDPAHAGGGFESDLIISGSGDVAAFCDAFLAQLAEGRPGGHHSEPALSLEPRPAGEAAPHGGAAMEPPLVD